MPCAKYVIFVLLLKAYKIIPHYTGNGEAPPKKKGVMIMMGVAKKKPELKSVKPDVMEQNQDGLEYSSEEDVDVDDLKDKLKEKGKKEIVKIDHSSIQYESFR